MLARLEQRFEPLVSRQRGSDPRHRSLRATLDWSYQLLSPELRRFFAQLSEFRGSWTLEAAEAVCEEPKAWEYLEQLRECSLVQADEVEGEMRFRLLETLREYSAEQLSTDETTALRRRHAAFFLAMAETAEPRLTGPEQKEWLGRLEREHDNLRAALEWASEAATDPGGCQDVEVGLRMGGALWRFWDIRGHAAEARARLVGLLALPAAERRTPERVRALHAAGWLAYRLSDYEAARQFSEESLAIARELNDRWNVAASTYTLASAARDQSEYEAARSLYEKSLALWRALEDHWGAASCLCDLGLVANAQSSYDEARARLEESLALCRQIDDRRGVARSLRYLGVIAYGQGKYAVARALFEESLAIQQALGDKGGIAQSLFHLGGVAVQQNDDAAARALFEESLSLARELGARGDVAAALGNLGIIAMRAGEMGRAAAQFEESLALCRELGDRRGIAWSLANLGDLALARGYWQAAASLYTESLAIRCETGQKRGIAESLEELAAVANGKGQAEQAARIFGAAATLRHQIGAPIPTGERADYERHVAATRAALGEAAFAAAWAEGEAMTLEEALACAFKVPDGNGSTR
jgi:tetratricopeptide (TPR) repeat protein